MQTQIVLGLGYGDEGKGLATDFLASQSKRALVVRFSGGHQAGHTVVSPDDRRHVFSQVGSGAFSGAATYWSKWCTCYPIGLANELAALGGTQRYYLDALAPVTTPYDLAYNRHLERQQKHGSCGLGFGATVERHETSPYRFYAQDLFFPAVWPLRLQAIAAYYDQKTGGQLSVEPSIMRDFEEAIAFLSERVRCVHEADFWTQTARTYADIIFEGSQGILLDRDHGFFPHVTRAHTTSRNAMTLIQTYQLPEPDIFYVTRAYQTRHGNGPLSNEGLSPELYDTPQETNQYNEWQGHQRRSLLDIDLLNYALHCDQNYSPNARRCLLISCCDQLSGPLRVTEGGEAHVLPGPEHIADLLHAHWHQVWLSQGPSRHKLVQAILVNNAQ